MELRPKHLRAIELLCGTDLLQKEVAAAVGVCPETITRWRRDKVFRRELVLRQSVPPYATEDLKTQAVRRVLANIVNRLASDEASPSAKDLAQLLGQLVAKESAHATAAPLAQEEAPLAEEDPFPTLTPEEADAAWAEIEREHREWEKETAEDRKTPVTA